MGSIKSSWVFPLPMLFSLHVWAVRKFNDIMISAVLMLWKLNITTPLNSQLSWRWSFLLFFLRFSNQFWLRKRDDNTVKLSRFLFCSLHLYFCLNNVLLFEFIRRNTHANDEWKKNFLPIKTMDKVFRTRFFYCWWYVCVWHCPNSSVSWSLFWLDDLMVWMEERNYAKTRWKSEREERSRRIEEWWSKIKEEFGKQVLYFIIETKLIAHEKRLQTIHPK